ncbi:MAG: hypothetical protein ACREJ6_13790, partial [Candidatus Methylomirabilis sp.]
MRPFHVSGFVVLLTVASGLVARPALPQDPAKVDSAPQFLSVNFADAKWEKMFPEFGADSLEISI